MGRKSKKPLQNILDDLFCNCCHKRKTEVDCHIKSKKSPNDLNETDLDYQISEFDLSNTKERLQKKKIEQLKIVRKRNISSKRREPYKPYKLIENPHISLSEIERELRQNNLVEFEILITVRGFRQIIYNQVFSRYISSKTEFLNAIFDELAWDDDIDMHLTDKIHYIILRRITKFQILQLDVRGDHDLLPFLKKSKENFIFDYDVDDDQHHDQIMRNIKILKNYIQKEYPNLSLSDQEIDTFIEDIITDKYDSDYKSNSDYSYSSEYDEI